jgi:hypothetical protein
MHRNETTTRQTSDLVLTTYCYVRQPYEPTLQAGGHRFDPGWLHWRSPCKGAGFRFLRSVGRRPCSALVINFGHQTRSCWWRDGLRAVLLRRDRLLGGVSVVANAITMGPNWRALPRHGDRPAPPVLTSASSGLLPSPVRSSVVLAIWGTLDRCDRACLSYHHGIEWIQVVYPTKAQPSRRRDRDHRSPRRPGDAPARRDRRRADRSVRTSEPLAAASGCISRGTPQAFP